MTPRTDKVVAVCDEDAYGLLVSFARQLEEEVNEARRYASRAGEDQIRLERELQAKDRTIERLQDLLRQVRGPQNEEVTAAWRELQEPT